MRMSFCLMEPKGFIEDSFHALMVRKSNVTR